MRLAGALATGFTLLSLAAGQSVAPQYTFHAGTRLVQINVVVDGGNGPVSGLTADDFTVTDNGHRQAIRVFSANRSGGLSAPAIAAPTLAAAPAPAAVYTNARPRAQNMVVVLFDALNSSDGIEYKGGQPAWSSKLSFTLAKRGALKFLAQLDPNARVALYALDTNLRVLSDFSGDRAQLLAALRAYSPAPLQSSDSGNQATGVRGDFDSMNAGASARYDQVVVQAHQIVGTVPALQAISNHLAGLPGRISLVWMMTHPPLRGAVVERALARDNIAVYPVDERGLETWDLGFTSSDWRGFAGAAHSLPAGLPQMEDIARQTGGRAFINTNDVAAALASAAADSASSYTLGFYVDAAALGDQFHQLRVAVRGKGRDARYPHGYWALRDEAAGSATAAAARQAAVSRVAVAAALRSPLEATGIPLGADLVPAGSATNGDLHLTATIGVANLRLATSHGQRMGAVVIETVCQDVAGVPLNASRQVLRWNWTEAEYERRLRQGIQLEQSVQPPAGAATLRLVVEDANSGAVGSLIMRLGVAH